MTELKSKVLDKIQHRVETYHFADFTQVISRLTIGCAQAVTPKDTDAVDRVEVAKNRARDVVASEIYGEVREHLHLILQHIEFLATAASYIGKPTAANCHSIDRLLKELDRITYDTLRLTE